MTYSCGDVCCSRSVAMAIGCVLLSAECSGSLWASTTACSLSAAAAQQWPQAGDILKLGITFNAHRFALQPLNWVLTFQRMIKVSLALLWCAVTHVGSQGKEAARVACAQTVRWVKGGGGEELGSKLNYAKCIQLIFPPKQWVLMCFAAVDHQVGLFKSTCQIICVCWTKHGT